MSALTPSPAVSKFKIAMYQKYFSDNDVVKIVARPRPQARAQPKGSPVKIHDPAPPVSLANKYRAPASSEILRLMEGKTSTASPFKLKFELLVSYNAFQAEAPAADRDPEWPNLLRNGTVSKTLDSAFGCKSPAEGDGSTFRNLLNVILNIH